jgi:hypothetical protein
MGQDNSYQGFHTALLTLLQDSNPGVRHNAALGLVRFGDASARGEVNSMLKPYTVRAPAAGTVELIVKTPGVAVAANARLARIKQSGGDTIDIRAPEAGRVESVSVAEGGAADVGSELMTLAPTAEQVWEALRALYIAGQPEDIPAVQRYTSPMPSMPDRIQKQAVSTLEAIRGRANSK